MPFISIGTWCSVTLEISFPLRSFEEANLDQHGEVLYKCFTFFIQEENCARPYKTEDKHYTSYFIVYRLLKGQKLDCTRRRVWGCRRATSFQQFGARVRFRSSSLNRLCVGVMFFHWKCQRTGCFTGLLWLKLGGSTCKLVFKEGDFWIKFTMTYGVFL